METIHLAPDWRVRPLDHLQWVLERRRSGLKGGTERWNVLACCRTRAGLETTLSRLRCDGIVLDPRLLASLPEKFPEPTTVPAPSIVPADTDAMVTEATTETEAGAFARVLGSDFGLSGLRPTVALV